MIGVIVIFVIILGCLCYCCFKNASNKRYQVSVYELGNQTTGLNKTGELDTQDNGVDDENL